MNKEIERLQKKSDKLKAQLREVEDQIKSPEYLKLSYKSNSDYATLTVGERKRYDAILKEKKPLLRKSRRLKKQIKEEEEELRFLKKPKPLFDVFPKNYRNH